VTLFLLHARETVPLMTVSIQGGGGKPRGRRVLRLVFRLLEDGSLSKSTRRRGQGGTRAGAGVRKFRSVAQDVGERMEVSGGDPLYT